jgi:hypothetical protein
MLIPSSWTKNKPSKIPAWKQVASLKCQLIFNILHGIIAQKTELLTAELEFVSAFLNIFAIAHVPLPTRWGAWIEAVNICSKNFETVNSIGLGLKRDKVLGDWRKLHNEELHNLYSSPRIIRMIK